MKKLALTLMAAAGLSLSAAGATYNLTSVADTSLRNDGGGPNTNYGSNTQLLVGSNVGALNNLLRFDLSSIGPGETVTSVTLNLHTSTTQSGSGGSVNIALYSYGFNFVEGSATWNNPTGTGSDATPGGTFGTQLSTVSSVSTSANQTFSFASGAAFISAVQSALGTSTFNLLMSENGGLATDQNFLRIDSKDFGGATVPTLVVTTAAVPEPSTYGFLGAGVLAGVAMIRRRRKGA